MRLALAWGCSARELLARLDSRELTEWMAFHQLEPWGCGVEDERAALAPAAVINANTVKGKGVTPADLVPDRDGSRKAARRVLTGDDAVAALAGWAQGCGG